MLTCLASRAVHIEVSCFWDKDSFILALWKLVTQRGSNSIGAEQEVKKVFMEMDDRKIQSFLQEQGSDWIR